MNRRKIVVVADPPTPEQAAAMVRAAAPAIGAMVRRYRKECETRDEFIDDGVPEEAGGGNGRI